MTHMLTHNVTGTKFVRGDWGHGLDVSNR